VNAEFFSRSGQMVLFLRMRLIYSEGTVLNVTLLGIKRRDRKVQKLCW